MKAKIVKKRKVKPPRLGNLSMWPLSPERALALFMKVDPKKVDKKMEQQGIFPPSKRKK